MLTRTSAAAMSLVRRKHDKLVLPYSKVEPMIASAKRLPKSTINLPNFARLKTTAREPPRKSCRRRDVIETGTRVLSAIYFGLALIVSAAGCGTKTPQHSRGPIWAGVATSGATSIALQFEFADDILSRPVSVGPISGVVEFPDPISKELIEAGPVRGNRSGSNATWATASGLTVSGTISGNTFSGDAFFPGALNYPGLMTMVNLTRQVP
jgi:hypothetical protein